MATHLPRSTTCWQRVSRRTEGQADLHVEHKTAAACTWALDSCWAAVASAELLTLVLMNLLMSCAATCLVSLVLEQSRIRITQKLDRHLYKDTS